jgi:release factor glutamine methyltransferase
MDIKSLISQGSILLKNNNIPTFQIDSEILMSKVIQKDKKYIILNANKILDKKKINNYNKLIKFRSSGKPIAYLTGKKSFWKYEFKISEEVLIPRPDTETIIEQVLKITKEKFKLKILDIGVGSGCIILSILKEKSDFYGVGVDLSQKCIDISKINARKLGLNNRVKFYKSDIDNFKMGKYDLIISNPPYIKTKDLKYLERDVIDFEPIDALNGGLDGLSEVKRVINNSTKLIKTNGKLVLEIAFDQKNLVVKLLRNKGFYINKIVRDYGNNYRCIVSTKIK